MKDKNKEIQDKDAHPITSKIFSYPMSILETHLDVFGHVNNAVYLTLFEEARWALLNDGGYGLQKIMADGLGPTILELKISFLKELKARDCILIETQMVSYAGKVGRLEQKMLRNEEVCCKADMLVGLFDIKARRLVVPTSEWLQAIGMENTPEERKSNS